jgi:glycosyltransferase involved in cell wall biosynthesis
MTATDASTRGNAAGDPRHRDAPGPPIAALIPAYNAARTVAAVVRQTLHALPEVLVVDDGSTDATAALAREAGALVLRHATNKGKGAGIRTGLRALLDRGYGRALVLDADGQHLAEEIPKLLASSDAAPAALVLGVRDKTGQPIAPTRRFANWFADHAVSLVAGRPFSDTQSGFRIYPIAETLALGARGDRMDFESEILILACRAGIPTREVTVKVYYPPPAERVSHYRPVADTTRIVLTVLEIPCRLLAIRLGLGDFFLGTGPAGRKAGQWRRKR